MLTVIKISASLERIGDYAKNMAKRTFGADGHDAGGRGDGGAAAHGARGRGMLKDVLDAYIQRDADLAQAVIERDRMSIRCTMRSSGNS